MNGTLIKLNCVYIFGSRKRKYGKEPEFEWSIFKRTYARNDGSKLCKLCWGELYYKFFNPRNFLNLYQNVTTMQDIYFVILHQTEQPGENSHVTKILHQTFETPIYLVEFKRFQT